MEEATMRDTRKTGRWLVAFALTMFTGLVLTDPPGIAESNNQAATFYAEGPGPARTIIAFYLAVVTIVCLFGLLASVLPGVWEAGHQGLAAASWAAAAGFAALYLAAASLFAVPAAQVYLGFGSGPVDPVFARTSSTLGTGMLLLAAPMLLSVCLALVSHGASRTGALPKWATRSGIGVAGLLLLGWTWFPLPLLVLWGLLVGTGLNVPGKTSPAASGETLQETAPR
jgi:hypothetical protein